MRKATIGRTSRTLLSFSLSSSTRHFRQHLFLKLRRPTRVLPGFSPLCSITTSATPVLVIEADQLKHEMLLERLRLRHLKDSGKPPLAKTQELVMENEVSDNKRKKKGVVGSFEELGLSQEVMSAVREMGIEVPTEIQGVGIPAVLEGKSVPHTGSGKTIAYMLPLVQLLRQDEAMLGMLMKPRRPRAVVPCPTRELYEQVFRGAKSISHHAGFRSTMVRGGGWLRPQEDSLNNPRDMVVGTPGRVLQHIKDGNIAYGGIKYLVLVEADTMFDHGFGPDIHKFLGPLKHHASKSNGQGFQTILVPATMTKAVQKLIDEQFQGIEHLQTSTLHKKIASARHDFIKLSGSKNRLEALLQGVENLNKFKSDNGDCHTLVCTDLTARGLDLDVDHVIMFDFPWNSIDYLHCTGRTARMGAKGKVTSLVAKKNLLLAERIEEAIRKNESLESLTAVIVQRDVARARITEQKEKNVKLIKVSNQKKSKSLSGQTSGMKSSSAKSVRASSPANPSKSKLKASSPTTPLKANRKSSNVNSTAGKLKSVV